MTVKIRPYKRGGWEADIMLTIPGRPRIRDRKKSPCSTKSASKRWGEERERQLIQHYTSTAPDDESRPDITTKEVPTLAKFFPRYISGHCEANRHRAPSIESNQDMFRLYLLPSLGRKRLDRLTTEDIQKFKADHSHLSVSTINLCLGYLRTMLNVAVAWNVIEALPTKIKLLKQPKQKDRFYDFEEFNRLIVTAERLGDPNLLLVVLLGGEAGLRRGELRGLEWRDIDMGLGNLTVARRIWGKDDEAPPKGGRARTVPLLQRLEDALTKHRHLRGPSVLCTGNNTRPGGTTVTTWLNKVQVEAGLKPEGPHILRHTFCSHLAMRGVPINTIKNWAGHGDIKDTERYMHLSPTGTREAVELMRPPKNWRHAGNSGSSVIRLS